MRKGAPTKRDGRCAIVWRWLKVQRSERGFRLLRGGSAADSHNCRRRKRTVAASRRAGPRLCRVHAASFQSNACDDAEGSPCAQERRLFFKALVGGAPPDCPHALRCNASSFGCCCGSIVNLLLQPPFIMPEQFLLRTWRFVELPIQLQSRACGDESRGVFATPDRHSANVDRRKLQFVGKDCGENALLKEQAF